MGQAVGSDGVRPFPAWGQREGGNEGDFTLLLVVGSGKTLEARSSHPEGGGKSQHR